MYPESLSRLAALKAEVRDLFSEVQEETRTLDAFMNDNNEITKLLKYASDQKLIQVRPALRECSAVEMCKVSDQVSAAQPDDPEDSSGSEEGNEELTEKAGGDGEDVETENGGDMDEAADSGPAATNGAPRARPFNPDDSMSEVTLLSRDTAASRPEKTLGQIRTVAIGCQMYRTALYQASVKTLLSEANHKQKLGEVYDKLHEHYDERQWGSLKKKLKKSTFTKIMRYWMKFTDVSSCASSGRDEDGETFKYELEVMKSGSRTYLSAVRVD